MDVMKCVNMESDIHIYGRHLFLDEHLLLPYTGSGVEFQAACSRIELETIADEEYLTPWISILVDGAFISRIRLAQGKSRICILDGLLKERIRTICIIKETPAYFEGRNCVLEISGVFIDGIVYPSEEKVRRIEFIGDSITSGEGLFGPQMKLDNCEWSPMIYGAIPQRHFATCLAHVLKADYRIVSQSGWGVFRSCENKSDETLPAVYGNICGVLKDVDAKSRRLKGVYDFGEWKPHLVVVGLGTNDGAACQNFKWTEQEKKQFVKSIGYFLEQIRLNYPDAWILWIYGMLKNTMEQWIRQGIQIYEQKNSDKKVSYLSLQDAKENEFGSVGHPGEKSHMRTAHQIMQICHEKGLFKEVL